jgi:membrane associated rhomboid family serine protease
MMPIRLTPAVKVILIICVAMFFLQLVAPGVVSVFALFPSEFAHGHFWQILTYAFLHTDPLQLVLNLMMVVFIGSELEGTWGTKRFVQFYLFCAVLAGACYFLLSAILGSAGPMMGASGAIYGLLAAYGILFKERVMLFMMLFPMKAKHFIWVLAGVEFLSSISYGRSGLASVAHLGGMAAGYGYLYGRAFWNVFIRQRKDSWSATQRVKRVQKANHLKLVKKPTPGDKDKTWH